MATSDINVRLWNTVSTDNYQLVEKLLEAGADPDFQNDAGSTALHQAIYFDRWEIARLLIAYGANGYVKDYRGNSVLDYLMDPRKPLDWEINITINLLYILDKNTKDYPIFHMTHEENLGNILLNGYILSRIELKKEGVKYKTISDPALVEKRNLNENMDYWVQFYFTNDSRMKFVTQTMKKENIVVFVSHVKTVLKHNLISYFTDMHAGSPDSKNIYNPYLLENSIDWAAIRSRYEEAKEKNVLKEKEAEFLIYGKVPILAIDAMIVQNNSLRYGLQMFINEKRVKLNENFEILVEPQTKY